jgi:hypothetical protein
MDTMSMRVVSLVALLGVVALATVSGQPPGQLQAGGGDFVAEEATISGILRALASRDVTCVQVVQAHLRRI